MRKKRRGDLLVIGGHENKESDEEKAILKQAANKVKDAEGRLVVLTVATMEPEPLADTYRKAFGRLGVKHVTVLDIRSREEAYNTANIDKLKGASVSTRTPPFTSPTMRSSPCWARARCM